MTITHGLWAYAPNGTIKKTGSRPDWRVGDNQETSAIAPNEILISQGWFPVIEGDESFDPSTQSRTLRPIEDWVLDDERVVRAWMVETLPVYPPTSDDVNEEASRRIAAGFEFQGKMYDYDDKAQKRITGAATLAGFAAGGGAPVGYLLWHGGTEPFAWIAMDNSLTEMDAPTCFAFGQAAAAWESAHVVGPKSARALKDTPGGIPADFADDKYWP